MRRLALLDTDFISKTHIVRVDDNNHLIDRVLELPECSFICHEQTEVELRRHNSHAPGWLDAKIKSGEIEQYTDERILKEMTGLYFNAGLYQGKGTVLLYKNINEEILYIRDLFQFCLVSKLLSLTDL